MDLVNLRLFDEHDAEGRLPEQLGALEDLRREGKLDLIGLSNTSADTLRRALELVDVACVQNGYSVVNRGGEDLLELCEERGLAFVPFFPLGSAFSGGPKALAADPAISEVAERRGATPSQVALAWLLHRSERILLIPGTSSVAHLEENLAAGDLELDEQDMERLEAATPVAMAH
jgi:aryl-alcohol dehydrogenase-like predicted oxidoreductase